MKICGLKDPELARTAVEAGADAIGIMMNETSPRAISPEQAVEVLAEVRTAAAEAWRSVDTVLVVSDKSAAEAARIAADLDFDVLQMHGNYGHQDFEVAGRVVERLWRATSLAHLDPADPDLAVGGRGEELLLLDAPRGGSGQTWDLRALENRRPDGRWLLAGGLNPDNVAAAIEQARPWGVDVSSGVETAPGVKDAALIRAFVDAARQATVV